MTSKFIFALVPIIILIIMTFIISVVFLQPIYIPLMVAGFAAILVSMFVFKNSFETIESHIQKSVSDLVPAILILFAIGLLSAMFMYSGIVPSLMYFASKFISVKFFLPTVVIVCAIISVSLGSSITTMATIGIAFVLTGSVMGYPVELVIGAVISGAMFGDKLSPMSDTTNIAAMLAGTDLFKHIKNMLTDTIIAFGMTLLIFTVLGFSISIVDATTDLLTLQEFLASKFIISPFLAIIPFLIIPVAFKRPPVLPTILAFSMIGFVIAITVQGFPVVDVLNAAATKVVFLDEMGNSIALLSRGGFETMLPTVAIIILAGVFGGVMHYAKMFDALIEPFSRHLKSAKKLMLSSLLFSSFVAFASGEQYMSIVLPSQTFKSKFDDLKIAPEQLSRCVESGGTVVSAIVPWGVIPSIAASIFEVSAISFIGFVFFAFLTPLVTIIRILIKKTA